jgi:hypothetical protein
MGPPMEDCPPGRTLHAQGRSVDFIVPSDGRLAVSLRSPTDPTISDPVRLLSLYANGVTSP